MLLLLWPACCCCFGLHVAVALACMLLMLLVRHLWTDVASVEFVHPMDIAWGVLDCLLIQGMFVHACNTVSWAPSSA
jgi:hypothetical protein